ncbi:ArpU family transcriptional regulator [Sutcliffiella horikoshii]|uniref:ArpU family phage packaging/lysis transcriptional regulator n=1 Tax=Sutcliffiella horikoshii TaxID=79883 RepID=UPI001CBC4A60|nr:ArpU family phage packaging/lysis transcriptional regulator [Sutcliffiella horikoshii]UAL46820.1 ArpU family transcriptional regulator [Sutcliffiella horikoshii]
MRKQLSFLMLELDSEKTKEEVEKTLGDYRLMMLTQPEEQLPKITPQYSLTPPTNTNEISSPTEDFVIRKVDREKAIQDFIQKVQKAVNRLCFIERAIIIKAYLDVEKKYHYEVYNDLGLSERHYNRLKSRAIYNLALALKVEVYIQNEVAK